MKYHQRLALVAKQIYEAKPVYNQVPRRAVIAIMRMPEAHLPHMTEANCKALMVQIYRSQHGGRFCKEM